ncbi:peptide methionine sulfoxide reductase [Sphingomonas sp. Leaf407]|nr:peptide methionine sulfoxide reductase [Sphingomonas sp. Leaf42]KQT25047.1 peptide methionine sulfoxide reductase [Sphingomonas sp. Leaf407]
MEAAGFGGGCHWCTEGVFQILRGVAGVDQGFLQSTPPDDAWAEGVVVAFDPAVVPLDVLIEVHLRTHSANSGYSPNGRYRSAVYVEGNDQQQRAEAAIARLGPDIATAARTKVLPLVGFRPSEACYRNYYRTDPTRPFCRRYIDPKLAAIRRDFAAYALQ